MLGLAVQPPPQAQSGRPLYPPLAVRLSSESNVYQELSQTWAVATLVQRSGEVLDDQLGGKVADSAHPLPDVGHSYGHQSVSHGHHHHGHRASGSSAPVSENDRAYFYFPDLVINEPGRYRIRVSLMEMDFGRDAPPEGMVKVREFVDSRSIIVEDRQADRSRPNSHERAFLRVLKDDGQEIPSP